MIEGNLTAEPENFSTGNASITSTPPISSASSNSPRPRWLAKIAANRQQVSSLIHHIFASEKQTADMPQALIDSSHPSFLDRVKIQQKKSIDVVSNLFLVPSPAHSKEESSHSTGQIAKSDLIEWLKTKGYLSLAEKIKEHSGYPWTEFEKIRSPILMEQIVEIHLLCTKKEVPEEKGNLMLDFALHLANLVSSQRYAYHYTHSLLNDAKQVLGQFIYLLNLNPELAFQTIDHESYQKSLENIKDRFSTKIQEVCERLQYHYLLHQSTQLQNPDVALHNKIPYEIARALLTDIGTINFGIIESLSDVFLSSEGSLINHESNLSHTLSLLQHSPRFRAEFEKITAPNSIKTPSNSVIQVALGIEIDHPIHSYETRLAALIAMLSHLRQGEDRSCFAVSLAIEILSAHLGSCFKDLQQLLEEGKLTRRMKGIQKDIPFTKKISDKNLRKTIVINKNGEIIIHNQPKAFLWEAPGLIAACQAIGISNPYEAIQAVMAQLSPSDERGFFQIKVKTLLRKLCEQMPASDPPKIAWIEQLYSAAAFAFSSQTSPPLLKVWENSIANMAEAEEGSMIKRAILDSTLDALQYQLGKLKIPPTLLLQQYFIYIQTLLYKEIHLQYDPTVISSADHKSNQAEGGFLLFYQQNKIPDEAAFRNFMHDILSKVKGKLLEENLSINENAQLNQVSDILDAHIEKPEFIGYLLARYHPSNKTAVKRMSQGVPIDYALLRYTPWMTRIGNDSRALLKIYLECDKPIQAEHFIMSGADEALTKIIEMCKQMPEDEKVLYINNPNKLKPLCILGKHRLPFMAGNHSLSSAWQKEYSTPEWIENFVMHPGKEISETFIDSMTKSQFNQKIEKEILPTYLEKKSLDKAIKLINRITKQCTIKQYRNYVLKICQLVHPFSENSALQKFTRQVDTSLCQSLEPYLKKQLENSAVHFADTNWCNGIQDIHFCFAVNPGTGKLELWEAQANGSHLMALDQNYWLNNQKWEFLTLPKDLIPDDSTYVSDS